MSTPESRFGDALNSIIETAKANGIAKQELLDALQSAQDDNTTWLWAWDEIGNEIEPRERDELDAINKEGGWELKTEHPNGVREYWTDRHQALEVEAESIEEARAKFAEVSVIYKGYQDD